jgi:hypothetical protein
MNQRNPMTHDGYCTVLLIAALLIACFKWDDLVGKPRNEKDTTRKPRS